MLSDCEYRKMGIGRGNTSVWKVVMYISKGVLRYVHLASHPRSSIYIPMGKSVMEFWMSCPSLVRGIPQ